MRIGIDIDDTLTNTKEAQIDSWKDYVRKYPNNLYSFELPKNINEFGCEYIEIFWNLYRFDILKKTTFKKNADIITKKLHEEGDTICIVTSRPDSKYPNIKENLKKDFIKAGIYVDEIYTDVRNKGVFCREHNIITLVDDSINHCNNCKENGVIGILFNNNLDYDGYYTDDWLILYEIISQIKKELGSQKFIKK